MDGAASSRRKDLTLLGAKDLLHTWQTYLEISRFFWLKDSNSIISSISVWPPRKILSNENAPKAKLKKQSETLQLIAKITRLHKKQKTRNDQKSHEKFSLPFSSDDVAATHSWMP